MSVIKVASLLVSSAARLATFVNAGSNIAKGSTGLASVGPFTRANVDTALTTALTTAKLLHGSAISIRESPVGRTVEKFLDQRRQNSANYSLLRSVLRPDFASYKHAIRNHADIDFARRADGKTALHILAGDSKHPNYSMVLRAILNSADKQGNFADLTKLDVNGNMALHDAASKGNVRFFQALVSTIRQNPGRILDLDTPDSTGHTIDQLASKHPEINSALAQLRELAIDRQRPAQSRE